MNAGAEAQRWLRAAGEELEWARHALSGGHAAPACFHAQQSAEKALKAVHYARGARVVLGHSVRALIDTLAPAVPELVAQRDGAAELDLLYIPTRYPNGLAEGTPGEAFTRAQATSAIDTAQSLLEAVRKLLAKG